MEEQLELPIDDMFYTIEFSVYAFETKEEAIQMRELIEDVWSALPEMKHYGLSSRIEKEVG